MNRGFGSYTLVYYLSCVSPFSFGTQIRDEKEKTRLFKILSVDWYSEVKE